ncbi:DUF397 domain-containing protein [Streptomyces sp. NPDC049099]|uniref:DUF397 domain-containing protein n=1 Tax=Streptomyces sp. NPDC049099 TaxID=3155768 RepID=UPI003413C351
MLPCTAAMAWFKSSYSSSEGGNCLEVAASASTVHIRDSKIPTGPTLSPAARPRPRWHAAGERYATRRKIVRRHAR